FRKSGIVPATNFIASKSTANRRAGYLIKLSASGKLRIKTGKARSSMSTTASPDVTVQDLEVFADNLDVQRAAAIFKEHGALVVRGLMKQYIPDLQRD